MRATKGVERWSQPVVMDAMEKMSGFFIHDIS